MIQEIRAAIFDLDGVIVDTAKYHFLAWQRLAKTYGFEFDQADNERLKGVSRTRSLEILLEIGGLNPDDLARQAMADQKNRWYIEYVCRMDASEILPGVEHYLKILQERKVKTAIGSASRNAPLILERVGISSLFDVIIDGSQVQQAKPDPEVFLRASEELRIPPENCVVFEDSEAGIEAAHRAGMEAVGIGKPEILKDADMVIRGLHQLVILVCPINP